MKPQPIVGGIFNPDLDQVRWLGERVLRSLAGVTPPRVLDIGCGDGTLLLHLAAMIPGASFVGVDLSRANIAAATTAVAGSIHRSRITLACEDYLKFDAGRFGLIVASSSLQAITGTTEELAAKLAGDLVPEGQLVHVTPYRCAYNSGLNVARRLLRRWRGTATDRMILAAARWLHPSYPIDRLRQRVDYMYLVIRRHEDALRAALERHGLQMIAGELAPHTSLGQPKHRFVVMTHGGQRASTR